MGKPNPTLAALSLALVLATSATPAFAQDITTSHGVRTLPRTDSMRGEWEFRQALRTTEEVVSELLADLDDYDRTGNRLRDDHAALPGQVKAANADYERAKASYDAANQKYLADLAAFNTRQAALEGEIQQQRQAVAAISPAMPLEQYNQEIARTNEWANRLSAQRTQMDSERNTLLAAHETVEAQRLALEKQRIDAETQLKGARDATSAQFGSSMDKRAETLKQLGTASDYLRRLRDQMVTVSKVDPGPSAVLERALLVLRENGAR